MLNKNNYVKLSYLVPCLPRTVLYAKIKRIQVLTKLQYCTIHHSY